MEYFQKGLEGNEPWQESLREWLGGPESQALFKEMYKGPKLPPPKQPVQHICPMSDPGQTHELCRQGEDENDPPLSVCFSCKGGHLEGKRYYYYCDTCDLEFHRGCHIFPLKMRHPIHPAHPLTLVSLDPNYDTSKIPSEWVEASSDLEVCEAVTDGSSEDTDDSDDDDSSDSNGDNPDQDDDGSGSNGDPQDDDGDHVVDDDVSPPSYRRGKKCKCCRRPVEDTYYHCSICNLNFNLSCMKNPPPLSILHSKSHDHALTLFPRRIPLPCDACELSLNSMQDIVYACLPCNYMVHRKCISLPRVIKITRHPHRLSFISSFPSGEFSCGVCRLSVDVSYGHFSCNKGCPYAVHSKCATRQDVWDGKDLEEVPEEPEENIEPFVRIDEETIQHFTHDHQLKLQGEGSLQGGKRFCDGCCLPVSSYDEFYSCMECEFVLHEACACLPRIKHHPLHKHPLILHQPLITYWISEIHKSGMFECHGCLRRGSGFVYQCGEKRCLFQLDVKCASLPDVLIHESHPLDDHPLFINLTKGECMGCKSTKCSRHYLECLKCKSFLGLRCATLPNVANYKHDSHPLNLCYGEKSTSGQYWCELCETKLDASEWFYTCDSCRVTLHVTCLLGIDMYMKPQHFIRQGGQIVKMLHLAGNTRPLCNICSRRCTQPVIFWDVFKFACTWHCLIKLVGSSKKKRLVRSKRR